MIAILTQIIEALFGAFLADLRQARNADALGRARQREEDRDAHDQMAEAARRGADRAGDQSGRLRQLTTRASPAPGAAAAHQSQ